MTIKKEYIITTIASLLAVLLFYAAISKLVNYEQSKSEMLNQVFPRSSAIILTWLIPTTEVVITILLLFKTKLKLGLWAATTLLFIFSIYIAVAMTGVFGRIPCGCGGILKNMSYAAHLLFNLCFVAMGYYGIYLINNQHTINCDNLSKERRPGKLV